MTPIEPEELRPLRVVHLGPIREDPSDPSISLGHDEDSRKYPTLLCFPENGKSSTPREQRPDCTTDDQLKVNPRIASRFA